MKIYEIEGFYGGITKHPSTIFIQETSSGTWYCVEGSLTVNKTYDEIPPGTWVEELSDDILVAEFKIGVTQLHLSELVKLISAASSPVEDGQQGLDASKSKGPVKFKEARKLIIQALKESSRNNGVTFEQILDQSFECIEDIVPRHK